jgi:leader peptidase (prepilin peptidase) / N-methyltransferase
LSAAAAAFAWTQPNPWAGALPGPVVLGLALMPMLVLAWFVYVASVIDLDHQIIPDELTKPMQLLAPFLVMGIGCNVAIEEPLPQQWLLRVDVFGVMTPTPLHLLAWMGGIGVGIIALLLLSVPLARWVYSRFTAQAPWSDDDHRGFRTGIWWFCACTVIQLVALAALLVFTPGGWWGLASLILAQAILGSLAGWCSLYLIGLLGTMAFRRNAMGFGDVKFLAPIGAFLGPLGVVYAFFAAAIIGTCIGVPLRILKSTRETPFGPYLAAGAIAVLVAGGWFHARLLNGILP